ncbi:hypothetical protein [Halobellus sp. H-GB7]|uniref:hypothetical protein n=1 Tax=Halobellus sp. H-GB7 TaxID=3069756 RepID=UPI0027B12A5E|nr:hypothetical protein [Halobellus sp. H-GB7]MDQ2053192.1 hypothetical protein [Halobellus sp. H-GB7]
MSETQQREGDLSFRDRSDREKLESLTEKYDADTKIGRYARNILNEMAGGTDAQEEDDDV